MSFLRGLSIFNSVYSRKGLKNIYFYRFKHEKCEELLISGWVDWLGWGSWKYLFLFSEHLRNKLTFQFDAQFDGWSIKWWLGKCNYGFVSWQLIVLGMWWLNQWYSQNFGKGVWGGEGGGLEIHPIIFLLAALLVWAECNLGMFKSVQVYTQAFIFYMTKVYLMAYQRRPQDIPKKQGPGVLNHM